MVNILAPIVPSINKSIAMELSLKSLKGAGIFSSLSMNNTICVSTMCYIMLMCQYVNNMVIIYQPLLKQEYNQCLVMQFYTKFGKI